VAGKTIAFTVRTAQQAKQLYGSGLKHKILTLPEEPGVAEGDPVEVALVLAFSGEGFHLMGRVVHSGAMATVVQLDNVPAGIYEALGVDTHGITGETTPALDNTMESAPISPEPRETVESAPREDPFSEALAESGETDPYEEVDSRDEPSTVGIVMEDWPPDEVPQRARDAAGVAGGDPPAEESNELSESSGDLFGDASEERFADTADEYSGGSLFDENPPEPAEEPSVNRATESREIKPPDVPQSKRPFARDDYSGEFERLPSSSGVETSASPPSQLSRPRPKPAPARAKAPSRKGGYVSARASRAPAQQAAPPPGEGVPVPGNPNQAFAGTPKEKGSLADVAMREVFMDLLNRKATGLLVVDGFRERYWGYFIDGQPVRYSREPPSRSESIEYQASRQRLLKPAELERARYAAGLTGLQLDDAMVRLGMLNRQQVDALMVESARMITDRLLGVNFGHFRFFDLPEVRKLLPGTAVEVAQVLWERSRQRYTGLNEKQVREIVDKYYKHHLVLTDTGRSLAEPLIASLAGPEQRFLKRYLRGGWQLAELLGRLEMPTRNLIELVLSMQDLGVIELNEREGDRWREARAERYIIDRMDYMERDHFSFVEAHWSCLEPELLAACDKVAKTIEDPMMDHLELEKLTQMREQIRTKLAEVRALFSDKPRRREYRNDLVEMGKRRMAGELFGKQGEMEVFKGALSLARECFERVLELDPRGSGSNERIRRAKAVLADLSRGATPSAAKDIDFDEEMGDVNLEDLDDI